MDGERPNPTIWAGPSKVGWVNYNPTDLASLFFSFFFLHWLGWTRPTLLGWAGKGLALPMLVAFCHLHAKSILHLEEFWRRKRRGRLAWPKEKRGWRCSWWYREDQRVVGYGNDDEDAVVTVVCTRG